VALESLMGHSLVASSARNSHALVTEGAD
jgi:hypothetical protein